MLTGKRFSKPAALLLTAVMLLTMLPAANLLPNALPSAKAAEMAATLTIGPGKTALTVQLWDSTGDDDWKGAALTITGASSGEETFNLPTNDPIETIGVTPGDELTFSWENGESDFICAFALYYEEDLGDPFDDRYPSWEDVAENSLLYRIPGELAGQPEGPLASRWIDSGIRAGNYAGKNESGKVLTIASEAELGLFAHELRINELLYDGWEVKLSGNLDLSGRLWQPVNMQNVDFNGNNSTIQGMEVTGYSVVEGEYYDQIYCAGLFGVIDRGVVQNLTLDSPEVIPGGVHTVLPSVVHVAAGAVAGEVRGSQIRSVTVIEPEIMLDVLAHSVFAGGIVGHATENIDSATPKGMNVINGALVSGGRIGLTSMPRVDYYDRFYYYMGGIAGANYNSVIVSSTAKNTQIFVCSDDDDDVAYLYAGGIAGYTSMTDVAETGFCLLNNLSLSVEFLDEGLPHEWLYGGISGLVKNDWVINNLYISEEHENCAEPEGKDSCSCAFGEVDNDLEFPDDMSWEGDLVEFNYTFSSVTDAWNYGSGNGTLYDELNSIIASPVPLNMYRAASVIDAHTEYGIENSLSKCKVWRTDGDKNPYLDGYNQIINDININIPATGGATPPPSVRGTGYTAALEWQGVPAGGRLTSNTEYTVKIAVKAELGYILPESLSVKVNGTVNAFVRSEANSFKEITLTRTIKVAEASTPAPTLAPPTQIPTHRIKVSSGKNGKVKGGGRIEAGRKAVVRATAKKGYVFDGWYENGKKVSKAKAKYSFTVSKNRKLKAKFKPIGYKVRFDASGGRIQTGNKKARALSKKVYYNTRIRPPGSKALTMEGKEFAGWYTKKKGGARVTSKSRLTGTSPVTVLYARWKDASRKGVISTRISPLRLRRAAWSTIITTVPKGTAITVLDSSGSWYKVQIGSRTGYMWGGYITLL
ncbi:MAG: InlB B-repeat-containing protein [Oscillospiraceae bacterium]|nr:InlB B-repeat-containing protein [Oscillospiraceae bacterium]